MAMIPTRARNSVLAWLAFLAASLPVGRCAFAADPKVPPAVERGDRVPVAILTAGFDYTRGEIAARLARDGEGEIIAWDVPGEDRFPYSADGDTELMIGLADQLPASAPVSFLAVKVEATDPTSLAKGLAFVARTPARTVIVPMWSEDRAQWDIFAQAAAHFSDLRLVVRLCPDLPADSGSAVYPRDLDLAGARHQPMLVDDPADPLFSYLAALSCRRP